MAHTNQVATKSDIEGLKQVLIKTYATKKELKRVEKNLRGEILRVEERVENIEESQKRVETKLDKLQNTLDGFINKVETLTQENEVGAHHTRQLRVEIDDHEKRIKHLESSTQTA